MDSDQLQPHYRDDSVTLYSGDCLDVLAQLPDDSVDSIVTDPPYGLGFMGKEWDDLPPGLDFAKACLRVLKPGGHMLAFGGTRTWHRLACAIEDAGFEVRDSIAWLYGSGFPKSLDVSKAIDKAAPRVGMFAGFAAHYAERRQAVGMTHNQVCALGGFHGAHNHGGASTNWERGYGVPTLAQWATLAPALGLSDEWLPLIERVEAEREITGKHQGGLTTGASGLTVAGDGKERRDAPATPEAQQWAGWGTALKPAFEPIVVARKPLAGTVAANVLAYGTGALNIDACRIEHSSAADRAESVAKNQHAKFGTEPGGNAVYGDFSQTPVKDYDGSKGRWPANVVLDESQAAALDTMSGIGRARGNVTPTTRTGGSWFGAEGEPGTIDGGDTGGASRFFYTAKAPQHERPKHDGIAHPTVKPLELMRWLVRLVTPPGGVVLDPFAGSGTTAEACVIEHFRCITIEREPTYLPLIVARLSKPIQVGLDFGSM